MTKEEWRSIISCPGYEVSNLGRVRSVDRVTVDPNGRAMRFRGNLRALRKVCKDGRITSVRVTIDHVGRLVHCLVLEAFVGPRPPGADGCHNDGDASNNVLSNLRWDTRESNVADVYRHGIRRRDPFGTHPSKVTGRPLVSAYLSGLSAII